jgi:hypothetical protein
MKSNKIDKNDNYNDNYNDNEDDNNINEYNMNQGGGYCHF